MATLYMGSTLILHPGGGNDKSSRGNTTEAASFVLLNCVLLCFVLVLHSLAPFGPQIT